jgi:hypothetical protein
VTAAFVPRLQPESGAFCFSCLRAALGGLSSPGGLGNEERWPWLDFHWTRLRRQTNPFVPFIAMALETLARAGVLTEGGLKWCMIHQTLMRSNTLVCALFVSTMLAVAVNSATAGTVIHVPADQPTIQAGINAAVNGDTVLVAPGT